MVAIYDKVRPTNLDEFIGFSNEIRRLTKMRDAVGWDGQVFWISGMSGTGKTTLARIIANGVASDLDTDEVDAADVSIEMLRDWEKRCTYYPQEEAYAFIINEAHCLNGKIVSRLQTLLETDQVQKRGTFIFTTTDKGQQHLFDTKFDAFPFLSRAITIELQPDEDTFQAMAVRLLEVARSLNLDGKPLPAYQKLLIDCSGNMRMALQKIAGGCMLD